MSSSSSSFGLAVRRSGFLVAAPAFFSPLPPPGAFGPVSAVDDKTLEKRERKKRQVESAHKKTNRAKLLKLADKPAICGHAFPAQPQTGQCGAARGVRGSSQRGVPRIWLVATGQRREHARNTFPFSRRPAAATYERIGKNKIRRCRINAGVKVGKLDSNSISYQMSYVVEDSF
jgi:hypothetical protein